MIVRHVDVLFTPPATFDAVVIGAILRQNVPVKMVVYPRQPHGWALKVSEGVEHSLADYRGDIVVLDFWGTWCIPCKKAMPHIQAMHEKYKNQGVVVFGLACSETNNRAPAEYMRERGYDYGCLVAADDVADTYGVHVYPTMLLIDREGRVIYRGSGTSSAEELEQALIKHLDSLRNAALKYTVN